LQITVYLDSCIASRVYVARENRPLKSKIPRESENSNSQVVDRKALQRLEGPIRAVIVGEKKLILVSIGDRRHN
jgi:hypothetical protein